jgi:hypothetical protein
VGLGCQFWEVLSGDVRFGSQAVTQQFITRAAGYGQKRSLRHGEKL